MSDGRCRACGAAVAPNAAWCSLCFADLRPPAPEPVREPAAVAAVAQPTVPAQPLAAQPLAAQPLAAQPLAAPPLAAQPLAAQPLAAPPVSPVDPTDVDAAVDADSVAAPIAIDPADPLGLSVPAGPSPTWPCPRCGHSVPIELDACNECGAGFLSGAAATKSVRLPMVGDVTRMSSGQRMFVAFAVSVGVMFVLVLLAFIGGHLFG
jgi:hypothetical protein